MAGGTLKAAQTLHEELDPILEQAAVPAPARPAVMAPPGRGSSAGSGRLWLSLIALVGVVAAAAFLVPTTAREDAHFAAAKAILSQYEQSRPKLERNYNNPIYGEALAHLDQVGKKSPSWNDAQSLAANLRGKIEEFLRRSTQSSQETAARSKELDARNKAFFDAQHRAALQPVPTYAECEHEGGKARHRH